MRDRLLKADTVAGGVIFVFALVYLATTFTMEKSSFTNAAVGPRALPLVIGVSLAAAALALVAQSIREAGSTEQAEPEAQEEDPDNPPQSPIKFAVVAGLLLAYIFLFVPLGYVISTFLFLLGATMYLDRARPVRNVVYSLAFSLIVYFVFTRLLGVILPPGPLGI